MFFYQINEDLSLRLLSGLDAEQLFKLIDESRSHLRQWLPWVDDMSSVDDSKRFIEHSMLLFNNQQALTTGIFYQNKLAGLAGYNEFDWKNRSGSIGYWLGSRYQGKGIMTQVVSALIEYGFNHLQLHRIDIRAASKNLKSRAIPERLGFSYEGKLRESEWLYDHYVNHAVYSLLAREWI